MSELRFKVHEQVVILKQGLSLKSHPNDQIRGFSPITSGLVVQGVIQYTSTIPLINFAVL